MWWEVLKNWKNRVLISAAMTCSQPLNHSSCSSLTLLLYVRAAQSVTHFRREDRRKAAATQPMAAKASFVVYVLRQQFPIRRSHLTNVGGKTMTNDCATLEMYLYCVWVSVRVLFSALHQRVWEVLLLRTGCSFIRCDGLINYCC